VRPILYESVRGQSHLPAGAYIFADLERLGRRDYELAARLAARIAEAAPGTPLLNDPRRACRRVELLRALHNDGVNSFTAHRADELVTPTRWPVFVRGEHDHDGNVSALIHDERELAAALARDRNAGIEPRTRLVVEFADTRSEDGYFRKYGVFRIGERYIRRHVFFSRDWMVKLCEPPGDGALAEERAFIDSDADAEAVRAVFERAGIEYGRVDYSRNGDGIEVWEINTNPMIISPETRAIESRWALNVDVIDGIVGALLQLANKGEGGPRIPIRDLRGVRPPFWRL
jgi:hypothetical protein